MANRLLVFVCTGNICRSPMAEYLCRERLGPDSGWEVCSAGVAAGYGMQASGKAREILAENGIDAGSHRSMPLTPELVDAASLIVVMTASHRDEIQMLYPEAREKVFLLKSFASGNGGDIVDPIGMSADTYAAIQKEIENALPGLVEFMKDLE